MDHRKARTSTGTLQATSPVTRSRYRLLVPAADFLVRWSAQQLKLRLNLSPAARNGCSDRLIPGDVPIFDFVTQALSQPKMALTIALHR